VYRNERGDVLWQEGKLPATATGDRHNAIKPLRWTATCTKTAPPASHTVELSPASTATKQQAVRAMSCDCPTPQCHLLSGTQATDSQPVSPSLPGHIPPGVNSTMARQIPASSPGSPPPVRPLLPRDSSSSAAIPDQAPGSGPLRVLLYRPQYFNLIRAPQEGGRGPAGHTPPHQPCEYSST
jgi:hypothetical protein